MTNLIDILAAVRGVDPEVVEAEFAGARYGEFKLVVAGAVVEYLRARARALQRAAR